MLVASLGYMVPYVDNLVKDFKALAEPSSVLQILALAHLRQIDASQAISLIPLSMISII